MNNLLTPKEEEAFDNLKSPQVLFGETDEETGTTMVYANKEFVKIICKRLKKEKVTKKEVGDFIIDALEKALTEYP